MQISVFDVMRFLGIIAYSPDIMRAKDLARSASGSHLVDRVKKAGVVAPWNAP